MPRRRFPFLRPAGSITPRAGSPAGRALPACPACQTPPPHQVPCSSAARTNPSTSHKRGALRRLPPPYWAPGTGKAASYPPRPHSSAAPPAPSRPLPERQRPRHPDTAASGRRAAREATGFSPAGKHLACCACGAAAQRPPSPAPQHCTPVGGERGYTRSRLHHPVSPSPAAVRAPRGTSGVFSPPTRGYLPDSPAGARRPSRVRRQRAASGSPPSPQPAVPS